MKWGVREREGSWVITTNYIQPVGNKKNHGKEKKGGVEAYREGTGHGYTNGGGGGAPKPQKGKQSRVEKGK